MHPIAAFCRRNLNALGLELYSIAYPLLPKDRRDWLFEKNVNIVPAETGVKIIDKDEESITIGKFNKDGTYSDKPFRILTTTDIHLGDTPSLRRKAMQMLANHIAQAKPDLVIFTGDIILSKFQQLDSVQFARFMEKTGVYWAIVFGNHEVREEKGFYKWLMLDSMRRYPHCLALHGDDSLYGYGNYRIDIKNGENSLLQSLYLFDSGRDIRERYYKDYGVPDGMKGYDFLKPEQIEWYKNCVRRTEEKYGKVKSMMYFHIPLPEFEHVMKLDENGQSTAGCMNPSAVRRSTAECLTPYASSAALRRSTADTTMSTTSVRTTKGSASYTASAADTRHTPWARTSAGRRKSGCRA